MIVENLKLYFDNQNISIYEVEKKLSLGKGTLYKSFKESKSIGSKIVENILLNYPDINISWLLTGNGSMTGGNLSPKAIDQRPIIEIKLEEGKPNTILADVKAAAGFGNIMNNPKQLSKLPAFYTPNAPFGLNVAFQITGDSMHPRIRNMDYIIGTKVENFEDIKEGFVYIIIDKDDGAVCKRIKKIGNDFLIVSDNPTFNPYPRPRGSILAFFKAFYLFSNDFRSYYDDTRKRLEVLESNMDRVMNKLDIKEYLYDINQNK